MATPTLRAWFLENAVSLLLFRDAYLSRIWNFSFACESRSASIALPCALAWARGAIAGTRDLYRCAYVAWKNTDSE